MAPLLQAHPACQLCPLSGCGNTSTGIAARLSNFGHRGLPRALLVVGEAPGRQEDETGRPFVGQSGEILHRLYLGVLRVNELADVYLSNAVRCRPPNNADPTKGQIHKCQEHLFSDIRALQAQYEEVVILAVGAIATESVLGISMAKAFTRQGDPQNWGWCGTEGLRPCPVFVTYHPANILNKRNPSRVVVIKDHIRLLYEYLAGREQALPEMPVVGICPPVPNYQFRRLSLDVETYGKVRGEPPQRCFHPAKCLALDKPRQLVYTATVTWRDPSGEPHTAGFRMAESKHRSRLAAFIRNLEPAGDLCGMNIKYDLMQLRAAYALYRAFLGPYLIRLTDLSVLNYLHSEQRPERSLKSIAPLLRIAKYKTEEMGVEFRYPTGDDPELMNYNGKDSWATLVAIERLESRIAADFPNTDKLSEFSRNWYSTLLWTCLLMEESGVAFNVGLLDKLDYELVLQSALLYSECRHIWGLLLAKEGSGKSVQGLFNRAAEEANLVGDPRLELTEKRKDISCNQKNASLFLEVLPPNSLTTTQLRKQQLFEAYQKMVTTYTRPMLYGTDRNPIASRLVSLGNSIAIAYPSWYPTPSEHDSGTSGGTIQGRITCKGPALQTLPKHSELGKRLQACFTTRFTPGFLIGIDLSQIELRVAALLSGDPVMMEEYRKGIDRHTKTAKLILRNLLSEYRGRNTFEIKKQSVVRSRLEYFLDEDPKVLKKLPDFECWRQMGKTTNFLILFRGGAFKLRGTFLDDIGVDLPIGVCDATISETKEQYHCFDLWQDSLVDEAFETGRLVLPLTGQSRTFIGSRKVLIETYLAEICNFKVQTVAANTTLDIQSALLGALQKRYQKVHCGLNVYDAIYLDGPASEYRSTLALAHRYFGESVYWNKLCQLLDRTVPLGYDISVLRVDSCRPVLQPAAPGVLPPKGNQGGKNGPVEVREGGMAIVAG